MVDTLHLQCGTGGINTTQDSVQIDNACITVEQDDIKDTYQVLMQNSQCWGCPLEEVWSSLSYTLLDGDALNDSNSFQVQTRYSTVLEVMKNNTVVCNTSHHFEQFGVYNLDLNTCGIQVISRPVNAFLPILWAAMALFLMICVRQAYLYIYKTTIFETFLMFCFKLKKDDSQAVSKDKIEDTVQATKDKDGAKRKSRRVRSLDAFRGLAITIMIFV